jgi:hypothetical protein
MATPSFQKQAFYTGHGERAQSGVAGH